MNRSDLPLLIAIVLLFGSTLTPLNSCAEETISRPATTLPVVDSDADLTDQTRSDLRKAREAVRILDVAALDAAAESLLKRGDYTIKPKDILNLIVYGEPELSKDSVRVSIDGNINMPLIGNVAVNGMSISGVEKKVETLLRDGYLLNPQVSILLGEYGRRVVFVLGAVGGPGSYSLPEELTLLEIITQAGGIGDDAGDRILIKRMISGERKIISIDRKKLFEEGDLNLNVQILDQDFIFVPPSDIIYLLGEVNSPGAYPLRRENKTIFRALLQAGGVTAAAASKRIRVIRDTNGVEDTIKVNLEDFTKRGDLSKDIDLQPADIVIVPVAYF